MTVHDGGDGGLKDCGGEAGEDGCDAAEDALIQDGGLGEIGNFSRATDVGGCGEKGVLEDGAEKGVGTEAIGGLIEDFEEVGCGVGLAAGFPLCWFLPGGDPAEGLAVGDAGVGLGDEKKKAHIRGDFDLSVEVSGFELAGTLQEGIFEFGGVLDRGAEGGGSEAVEGGGAGIEDDEAVGGEEVGDESSEGAAESLAGGIELAKEIGFGSEVEEFGNLVEDGVALFAQGDGADGFGFGGMKMGVKGFKGGSA